MPHNLINLMVNKNFMENTDKQKNKEEKQAKRKIVLLGTGSGVERAPLNKTGYEFWGLSGHWNSGHKFDRIYELHSTRSLNEQNVIKDKGDWMYTNVTNIHPTLTKCFPNAKVFDFDKYLDKYGKNAFRCSMSWMMAEAIEEKPHAIEVYGITLSGKDEYKAQKPSMAAFILVARVLGIKVYVDRESELFSCPWVYGYEEKPDYLNTLSDKRKKLERDLFNSESDVLEARAKFNKLEGVKEAFEWFGDNYGG